MEENENNKEQQTPPINRLSESERRAIKTLYDRYAKALFVYIRYHVDDDPDVVNELFQISIERICRKVNQIPEGRKAFGWMSAFAQRVIWEYYRRKRQYNKHFVPYEEKEGEEENLLTLPADEEYMAKELQDSIYTNLHVLTDREKIVFLHVFEDGISAAEISVLYKISVQTVRNYLCSARAKLSPTLKEHYNE